MPVLEEIGNAWCSPSLPLLDLVGNISKSGAEIGAHLPSLELLTNRTLTTRDNGSS